MKNLLFTLISILIFLIILLGSLNLLLSGVPLFNIFNIDISDAIYFSKKEENKNLYKTSFNKNHFVDKCGKSENGFYNLSYKKDIFGFRDNEENLFYDTNLVIIGDSFGISSCVNYPNDFNTKLKEKLPNRKILNISKGGTGPYYQKEMLINLLNYNNTKFDSLVWLFYEGNDHGDLKRNYEKKIDFNFEKISNINGQNKDETKVNYTPKDNIFILKSKLFLAKYLRGFGSLVKYFKVYPSLLPNEKYYDDVVKDLSDYLVSKNINNKIIFYIPSYTRLSYNKINHPHLSQFNDLKSLIKKTAIKYNFIFIDGSSIYHDRKNPLDVFHYRLPTHFNLVGYEILAQNLSLQLK